MNFWQDLENFTATDERARRITDLCAAGHLTNTEAETEILKLYRDKDFVFFVEAKEKGSRKKWVKYSDPKRYRTDAEQVAKEAAASGTLSANNRPIVYRVTPVLLDLFYKESRPDTSAAM